MKNCVVSNSGYLEATTYLDVATISKEIGVGNQHGLVMHIGKRRRGMVATRLM